jgi:Flp pilus assembly protein TadD
MNKVTTLAITGLVVLCLACLHPVALGQEMKMVIGPSNIKLHNGSELLKRGEAKRGLELTLEGLADAATPRERVVGMSNACAANVMLGRYKEAVSWCDQALEIRDNNWRALVNRSHAYLRLGQLEKAEADLLAAEELAPGSRSVKLVRSMYLDVTDPVAPHVVIDDRRQGSNDEPK